MPYFETSKAKVLQRVHKWIDGCVSTHQLCGSGDYLPLPTRVLEIGQDDDLIFLTEFPSNIARYACLSYCWGLKQPVVTTTQTLGAHKNGIKITSLPRTIRDSVHFARLLKLPYIWIDVLCIVQDDEKDWRKESARVAAYYGNAYITLAATKSENVDGGLISFKRVRITTAQKKDSIRWVTQGTWHEGDGEPRPLFQRGWVFQERLLSPRVLHFCRHELVFECREGILCQCNLGIKHDRWAMKQHYASGCDSRSQGPTDLELTWHRMVEEYSRLQLSKASDKLPALSGLAEDMKLRRHTEYAAGLWVDTLLSDLLWMRSLPSLPVAERPPWRAPSWSWASFPGAISYYDTHLVRGHEHLRTTFCEVIDVQTHAAGPSTTAEVISGFIRLQGRLLHVPPTARGEMEHHYSGYILDYAVDVHTTPMYVLSIGIGPFSEAMGDGHFRLLLRPVDTKNHVFERIGLTSTDERRWTEWERKIWGEPIQEITIV
jgi:hypothetical protein